MEDDAATSRVQLFHVAYSRQMLIGQVAVKHVESKRSIGRIGQRRSGQHREMLGKIVRQATRYRQFRNHFSILPYHHFGFNPNVRKKRP